MSNTMMLHDVASISVSNTQVEQLRPDSPRYGVRDLEITFTDGRALRLTLFADGDRFASDGGIIRALELRESV